MFASIEACRKLLQNYAASFNLESGHAERLWHPVKATLTTLKMNDTLQVCNDNN